MQLNNLVSELNTFLRIHNLPQDPAMSRHLPRVYDAIDYDWQSAFEPDFVTRFNGLLLRGADDVRTVFCAAFPSPAVLTAYLAQAHPGDMLFTHHPIDMRNGDPAGDWGEGFVPIAPPTLRALRDRRLSVYACHAPMDVHPTHSTTGAMVAALSGQVEGQFLAYGTGYAGLVAKIEPISHAALLERLLAIFNIPYVDLRGPHHVAISRIAVVAGVGDKPEYLREAETHQPDAYITGEIHVRIEGEYGRTKYAEVVDYARTTRMTLIGVSHAGSEFLVMRTHMAPWFKTQGVAVQLLPEAHWWR